MTYTIPPSTPVDGNIRTLWVPAIADIRAPKVSELNAVTAVDISLYITKNGFSFTPEQQYIDDGREPQKFIGQALGSTTVSNVGVTVIDNTGGPYEEDFNKAIEALEGDGYIVRRYGLDWEDVFAADQKVTVLAVSVGEKQRLVPEANTQFRSTAPLGVRDYAQDVAVVAGA